ncbi:hypothetical protein EPO17_02105 [Patescibacteria group bacterium]|nr:MAG: hypothetical protein EPO17_02105 [Patescibacteria group bacterium]
MGKRGPKPKSKVVIKWSADFAYGIGLIVSDGCLSKDGRHITFVSKDKEQINNFMKAFKINVFVGLTFSGYNGMSAYRVQFSDIPFYTFLLSLGITPAKSKTIGRVLIPEQYLFDFIRGVFDGDGTVYSYWDKRWKSSFMFYISFISASDTFIQWLRMIIENGTGSTGHIKKDGKGSTFQLTYAKKDSIKIINKMYQNKKRISLSRKSLKIKRILGIVGKSIGHIDK